MYIDQGEYDAAKPMLQGGLALAEEMSESGLAARFVANLALVHTLSGELPKAIEYGTTAIASARERGDANFEALSATNLAHALRLSGQFAAAAKELQSALGLAEVLGYAHVICAALRQFALLQLENGRRCAAPH